MGGRGEAQIGEAQMLNGVKLFCMKLERWVYAFMHLSKPMVQHKE